MENFTEFAAFATTYPMAILSLPICLLAFYWFLTLIGLFDIDADFDFDFDSGFLSMAGLGQVPLAIGLTIWFVLSWVVLGVLVHHISPLFMMEQNNPLMIAIEFLFVLGSLFSTMPITKWFASKLSPLFKIKEAIKNSELIGCQGKVISNGISEEYGEVELTTSEGFTIRGNATTYINESFEKGDKIQVVDFDEEKSQYIITKSNI